MTSKGIDYFENQYYDYIRGLLTPIGLWPYQESSKRLRYGSIITIFLVIGISGQLKECLNRVRNDWYKVANEEELNIMQAYATESKLYSKIIAHSFYLYTSLVICPSMLCLLFYAFGLKDFNQLILPLHREFVLTSKFLYYGFLLLELTIITITRMIGVAHYSLFVLFVQHACALFIILTYVCSITITTYGIVNSEFVKNLKKSYRIAFHRTKMEKPFRNNECKFDWTTSLPKTDEEYDWIVTLIKYYNDAIECVELMRELYKKEYIVGVILELVIIIVACINFFQLINMMLTTVEAIRNCIYIAGSIFTIYVYMYVGQRLMDHCNIVHTKFCLIPFYKLSIKTNKSLLLLIMRSLKPCNMSVGGIAVASHELFTKMTKTSFSFAAVCYKMQ